MITWVEIPVRAYSGYTYAQRPLSFPWEGQTLQVKETEAEWREPGARGFQVRTEGDRVFRLIYREAVNAWWGVEVIGASPRREL